MLSGNLRIAIRSDPNYRKQIAEFESSGKQCLLDKLRGMENEILEGNGTPRGAFAPGKFLSLVEPSIWTEVIDALLKNGRCATEILDAIENLMVFTRGKIALHYTLAHELEFVSIVLVSVTVGVSGMPQADDQRFNQANFVTFARGYFN